MSDDEKDIDIESECEEEEDGQNGANNVGGVKSIADGHNANKRAHHNALERKRRDHIKDSFTSLRDCVPALIGEKSSRAQILKKASDYIDFMKKKIACHQQDIEVLERQNQLLETQLKSLEKTKYTGNFAAMSSSAQQGAGVNMSYLNKSSDEEEEPEEDEEDDEPEDHSFEHRRKKLKS